MGRNHVTGDRVTVTVEGTVQAVLPFAYDVLVDVDGHFRVNYDGGNEVFLYVSDDQIHAPEIVPKVGQIYQVTDNDFGTTSRKYCVFKERGVLKLVNLDTGSTLVDPSGLLNQGDVRVELIHDPKEDA